MVGRIYELDVLNAFITNAINCLVSEAHCGVMRPASSVVYHFLNILARSERSQFRDMLIRRIPQHMVFRLAVVDPDAIPLEVFAEFCEEGKQAHNESLLQQLETLQDSFCLTPPGKKEPQMEELRDVYRNMDDVQTELDLLTQQEAEEVVEVEKQTNAKRDPLYLKRAEIIEKIPGFWGAAWMNHPQLKQVVNSDEVGLVSAILAVDVEDIDRMTAVKIRVMFGTNEFFENEKIEKTLRYQETPGSSINNIRWKNGKAAPADDQPTSFIKWISSTPEPADDYIAEIVKDDLWVNPLKYYNTSGILPEVSTSRAGRDESRELSEEL